VSAKQTSDADVSRPAKGGVVPPRDLLEQVTGIEDTLQTGRRLSVAGWFALLLGLVQAVIAIATGPTFQAISKLSFGSVLQELSGHWLSWTAAATLVVAVVLGNWTRLWIRVSREPFRYTYSISDFEFIGEGKEDNFLPWLRVDLATKLSERIQRLSRLDHPPSRDSSGHESHIQITGTYGVRKRQRNSGEPEVELVEVVPWIQIGPLSAPARLAHTVTFRVDTPGAVAGPPGAAAGPPGKVAVAHRSKLHDKLGTENYEKLVERIYFSVATEIYKQIRKDVQRKIDLLPYGYFRASAYFYEAEDYVTSNTLDAYDEAQELYLQVIRIYDPEWLARPKALPRRILYGLRMAAAAVLRAFSILGSQVWTGMAAPELMVSRAYLGYANALLYRRSLAGLSGQRLNPIFEARPAVDRGMAHLRALPDHVEGKNEALFDAWVTLALVRDQLDSPAAAMEMLETARQYDPLRVEKDARYLYARGFIETDLIQSLQFLRRAVEVDPDYEVAQFQLALRSEYLWRNRAQLEPDVARTVLAEYDRVVNLNPANIAAWANMAFVYWLLEHDVDALARYERGREYKEIKRATFVAQIDHGLARLAAERGDWPLAYRHYVAATSATTAQGLAHVGLSRQQEQDYWFISDEIMQRFEKYKSAVESACAIPLREDQLTSRLRDSVLAFVLTDYGQACYSYFLRTSDELYKRRAGEAFKRARDEKLGGRYVMPHFYSHVIALRDQIANPDIQGLLSSRDEDYLLGRTSPDYLGEHMLAVDRLDPNWVDGNVELVTFLATLGDHLNALEAAVFHLERSKRQEAKVLQGPSLDLEAEPPASDRMAKSRLNRQSSGAAFVGDAVRLEAQAVVLKLRAEKIRRTEWRLRQRYAEVITNLVPHTWLHRKKIGGVRRVALGLMFGLLKRLGKNLGKKKSTLPRRVVASWLRRVHGQLVTAPIHVIDGRAFRPGRLRRRYDRELRWEREFDDIHAIALYAWATSDRTINQAGALAHLQTHFWAAKFDALVQSFSIAPEGDRARLKTMKALKSIIESSIAWLPEFGNLSWLIGPGKGTWIVTKDQAARRLIEVAETHRLNPALLAYVAGQLDRLEREGAVGFLKETPRAVDFLQQAANDPRIENRPDLLFQIAERLRQRNRWREAKAVYLAAAKHAEDALAVQCRAGAALTLCALGEWDMAVSELGATNAMKIQPPGWILDFVNELLAMRIQPLNWTLAFVNEPLPAVPGPPDLWRLRHWLRRQIAAHPDESAKADCDRALLSLSSTLEPLLQADASQLPVCEPVSILAHPDFFPLGGQTPQVLRMLSEQGIDARRNVLRHEIGIVIPPVKIRASNSLKEGTFSIQIDEITMASGRADPDNDYDAAMLNLMEEVLRTHAARLVGVQEVNYLLAKWAGDYPEFGAALGGVQDSAMLVRFVQTLRSLLAGQVSITDLGTILDVFEESASKSPSEIAELVRSRLDPVNLGLDADVRLVRLPVAAEQQLSRDLRQGRDVQKPSGATSRPGDVVHSIAKLADDGGTRVALVVRDSELRSALHDLVIPIDPRILVVSSEEVNRSRLQRPLAYLELTLA
jgi:tetratricopeptide (TPR) repeat protein